MTASTRAQNVSVPHPRPPAAVEQPPPGPAKVWRPLRGRICVGIPGRPRSRSWFLGVCGQLSRPHYDRDRSHWLIARSHFRTVVAALAKEYGSVDVYVDHATRTACGRSCQEAAGDECSCQCLGDNHGGGGHAGDGWIRVNEEFLIRHDYWRIKYRVTAADTQLKGTK